MKKNILIVVLIVALGYTTWLAFGGHNSQPKDTPKAATTLTPNHLAPSSAIHPIPTPLMARDEWQKYRSAREKALQDTPALQAEYQDILKGMDAQQGKLDAAMLKADPKLGPVLAKLNALKAQHSTSPQNKTAGNTPAPSLTPNDWQELRTARNQAIQSDSEFNLTSKKLIDRMRALEDKLDATMIKTDPSLIPVIAKFEAGRRPGPALVNASPNK